MEREFKKGREWLDKLTLYAIKSLAVGALWELSATTAVCWVGRDSVPFSSLDRMQIALSDSCKPQPIARGDGTGL